LGVYEFTALQYRHAHGQAALHSNFTSSLDIRLSWLLVLLLVLLLLLLQVQLLVADLEAALPAALKPTNCSWDRFLCSSKRCGLLKRQQGRMDFCRYLQGQCRVGSEQRMLCAVVLCFPCS
jgi:hypothetical protein